LFAILLYLVYETRTVLERGDNEELSRDLLLLFQVITPMLLAEVW